MAEQNTTVVIQNYLNELAEDTAAEETVRALLDRAAQRIHNLCGQMLYKHYVRLSRPPANLRADELLGGVVEELLKAFKKVRPATVRQFFALVNQHMRWQLNGLARRLDQEVVRIGLPDEELAAPGVSESTISQNARRMLDAIETLPDDEREVFDLIRLQNLTHAEAAEILDVSSKTVQRRLNRARILLSQQLFDLCPNLSDRSCDFSK